MGTASAGARLVSTPQSPARGSSLLLRLAVPAPDGIQEPSLTSPRPYSAEHLHTLRNTWAIEDLADNERRLSYDLGITAVRINPGSRHVGAGRCCRVSSRRSVSVIAAQLQKHASIPSPLASPMQRERHVVSSQLRRLAGAEFLQRWCCSSSLLFEDIPETSDEERREHLRVWSAVCDRPVLLCHVALSLHCATHPTLPTTHCAVGRSTDTPMSHAIQHRCQAAIDVLDTLVQAQVPHLN